jgi:hypothetical protein
MKILIFHDKAGKKAAASICAVLKNKKTGAGLDAKLHKFSPDNESEAAAAETEPPLVNLLAEATHIILVFEVVEPALFYICGFAAGKSLPLYFFGKDSNLSIYGYDALALPNEDAVLKHFKKIAPEYIADKKKALAKTAIIGEGFPVINEWYCNAVSSGKVELVQKYLDAGFSVNDANSLGVPALCLAARSGNLAMVSFLLKQGADVNAVSKDRGNSALGDAALGKCADIISALIKAGADLNIKSKDGQSALIISVGLNDEVCVKLLLKAGADADSPDSLGASARKYAVLFNKPKMIELFKKYSPK